MVGAASGALSATRLMQTVEVDLLLIDANVPPDEVSELLEWTAGHCPAVQCVVMTTTSQRREQALAWGAHAAFQRASLGSELEATVSRLSSHSIGRQGFPIPG
jgi:DNA-binding NarL/FixJ family response regulator